MTSKILSFTYPPEGFSAEMEAAGCFCECEGKILLLKRHPNKGYGNTWGIPAGKLETDEDPLDAVKREVLEETGLLVHEPTKIATLYNRLPQLDFIFHLFHSPMTSLPEINLALDEHIENCWISIDDAYSLPLIPGAEEAIEILKSHLLP